MPFARTVFRISAILGFLIVVPMYFLEQHIGRDYPPAITHPEFFYGFVGVTLACQVMFLLISTDPVRYRPMMLAGMTEKFLYAGAIVWLLLAGRAPSVMALSAVMDLTLGVLFVAAYIRTRPT